MNVEPCCLPELHSASDDPQPFRCRRYVGKRPRARDGECGLAAMVIIDGQPLCYVHTPVAYRRQLAAGRSGRRVPSAEGESA
jgi:hypothetical protein